MPESSIFSWIKNFFKRERTPHKSKAYALLSYQLGLGFRLCKRLLALLGVCVSHVAIFNWLHKLENQALPVKKEKRKRIAADETVIELNKKHYYVFVVVDVDTDEPLSIRVTGSPSILDVYFMLKQALKFCKEKPRLFTDSAPWFKHAAKCLRIKHTVCVQGPQSSAERAFSWLAVRTEKISKAYYALPEENIISCLSAWVNIFVVLTMRVKTSLS